MAYKPQVLAASEGGTGATTLTGIVSGNGTSAFTASTITGTSNQITITNGTGVSGNPTASLTSTIQVSGISFDSGSNTLSVFATGTFTPTLTASTANPTVSYAANGQKGFYMKVGNKVYINAYMALASISGGTGNSQLDSLPFTVLTDANQGTSYPAVTDTITLTRNYTIAKPSSGNTFMNLKDCLTGTTAGLKGITSWASTSICKYSGYYNI